MIRIKNYLGKLNKDIKIYNVEDVLKEIHDKEGLLKRLFKNNFHRSTYYNWVSGKSPVSLGNIFKIKTLDKEILEKIYKKDVEYSVNRKKCILPKIFDTQLAYFIGALHGDGSLHKNGRYTTITTESPEYLKKVISPIVSKLFNLKGKVFQAGNGDCYRLEIGSKVLHSFLSMFCPIGKKKGKIRMPNEVLQHQKLLAHYLAGLFDTDGCLPHIEKNRKNLYFIFIQADKRFVFEIFESLKKLRLRVNTPRLHIASPSINKGIKETKEWRIYIGAKKDLYNFLKTIRFLHPMKRLRSDLIIKKIVGLERVERSTIAQ